jgi:hypothetical protein
MYTTGPAKAQRCLQRPVVSFILLGKAKRRLAENSSKKWETGKIEQFRLWRASPGAPGSIQVRAYFLASGATAFKNWLNSY